MDQKGQMSQMSQMGQMGQIGQNGQGMVDVEGLSLIKFYSAKTESSKVTRWLVGLGGRVVVFIKFKHWSKPINIKININNLGTAGNT